MPAPLVVEPADATIRVTPAMVEAGGELTQKLQVPPPQPRASGGDDEAPAPQSQESSGQEIDR
jgi:hypothetical protein